MRSAIVFSLLACSCVSAPPYAMCEVQEDCASPSEGCFELAFTRSDGSEARGALCTLECEIDADCPEDGACVALEGDPTGTYFCAQRCVEPMDCYAGFACTVIEGATRTMQLCLP